MKEMSQVLLFVEFILDIDREILRQIFLVNLELGYDRKMAFVF